MNSSNEYSGTSWWIELPGFAIINSNMIYREKEGPNGRSGNKRGNQDRILVIQNPGFRQPIQTPRFHEETKTKGKKATWLEGGDLRELAAFLDLAFQVPLLK